MSGRTIKRAAKRATGKSNQIIPVAGKGSFSDQHVGRDFARCVLELAKNPFDEKGASLILFDTTNPRLIRIVDDGCGMRAEFRDRFCSVKDDRSEAVGHGRFGRGTKDMLFAQASRVDVATVSDEQPDTVMRFGFLTDEYEELVRNGTPIPPDELPITKKTWPYPFRTGTEITYTFANPAKKSILRGRQLAELLAARLPRSIRKMVQVDGAWLPEPDREGEPFLVVDTTSSDLKKPVGIELFRIKAESVYKKHRGIWLAGEIIGDAELEAFYRVLPDDLKDLFPSDLRGAGLCGTLQCEIFEKYTNSDRESINPAICEGAMLKKTLAFILVLRQYMPQIIEHFGLTKTQALADDAGAAIIEKVREIINATYRKSEPPTVKRSDDEVLIEKVKDIDKTGGDDDETIDVPPTGAALQIVGLRREREYEPGEMIRVSVRFRPDIAPNVDLNNVRWNTHRAGLSNDSSPDPSVLIGRAMKPIGTRELSVKVEGEIYAASATYEIVAERQLCLLPQAKTIIKGKSFDLLVGNIDKLRGKLEWSHTGPGTFDIRERRCRYTATEIGVAEVAIQDTANPGLTAKCQIIIQEPPDRDLLVIEGDWFRIRSRGFDLQPDTSPVIMNVGSRGIHEIYFNSGNDSYQEELNAGRLDWWLIDQIALEFVHFRRHELDRGEDGDQSRQTSISLLAEKDEDERLRADARRIASEIKRRATA